jgi:hypothetical protein
MLKNILAKTMLSAAILAMATSAHAVYQDIAINGDFETGDFTGWSTFPGSLGAAGQTIVAGNPGSAANLNEPNPAANIIKQANLLAGQWTACQQVDIQFDLKGSAGAGGVFFVEFFNELAGGGVGAGSGILAVIGNPNANWTTYNYSANAGAFGGGITLQFNSTCGADGGCFADFTVDNVSISSDVSSVPVPAAAWLFGSALLGLGGIARKKKSA